MRLFDKVGYFVDGIKGRIEFAIDNPHLTTPYMLAETVVDAKKELDVILKDFKDDMITELIGDKDNLKQEDIDRIIQALQALKNKK